MYLETRDIDETMDIYSTAWKKGVKTTYYLHMKPRHTAEQSTVRVNKAEQMGKRGFAAVMTSVRRNHVAEEQVTVATMISESKTAEAPAEVTAAAATTAAAPRQLRLRPSPSQTSKPAKPAGGKPVGFSQVTGMNPAIAQAPHPAEGRAHLSFVRSTGPNPSHPASQEAPGHHATKRSVGTIHLRQLPIKISGTKITMATPWPLLFLIRF